MPARWLAANSASRKMPFSLLETRYVMRWLTKSLLASKKQYLQHTEGRDIYILTYTCDGSLALSDPFSSFEYE